MGHGKRVREGDVECWMCNLTEKAAPLIEWNWLFCSADTLQELIALEFWSEKLANRDFSNFLQTEFSNWITDNVGLLCKKKNLPRFFSPNKINNNWSWTFWMLVKSKWAATMWLADLQYESTSDWTLHLKSCSKVTETVQSVPYNGL